MIRDYIEFRRMLTPVVVQVVFWILTLAWIVVCGVSALVSTVGIVGVAGLDGSAEGATTGVASWVVLILGTLVSVATGVLLLRIWAESVLVFFRIHANLEVLTSIAEDQSADGRGV